MKWCVVVLLLALAATVLCEHDQARTDFEDDVSVAESGRDASELEADELSSPVSSDESTDDKKDPFWFGQRRRRSYVRRRRSYVRRRRSYVRRRRSYVRRRRSYVRRRRSYVRRRRSYVRRRRSYVRRRRSYVRRRRSYVRRRRSYVRRRRSYVRRRSSYLRRRRPYVRRRQSSVRRRSRVNCIPNKFRLDSCGRRCSVVGGRLVNCYRVRKDFESMTLAEQQRYVRAFKIMSTRQPYKKTYDRLIKMHENNFDSRIHQQAEFLPWHRWFNLQIENLLQKVDCKVTLAYWDWSLWSHDPWNSRKIWSSGQGLGGNGRRSDGCVTSGPFRVGAWKTTSGNCLRRGFNGNPPDADQVAVTLREPTFLKFEVMLRVNIHESMHCFINGTMCSSKSAEAPEFFFHHSFIDKIWADYQKKSSANKFAHFNNINRRMVGLNLYPRAVLNNDRLPGGVRVVYEDPTTHSARKIRAFLAKLSLKQLKSLERLAFSRTPESAKRMFRLSSKERKLASSLENSAMKGVDSKRASSIFSRTLSSLERVEGFNIPRYCTSTRPYRGDAQQGEEMDAFNANDDNASLEAMDAEEVESQKEE